MNGQEMRKAKQLAEERIAIICDRLQEDTGLWVKGIKTVSITIRADGDPNPWRTTGVTVELGI